MKKSVKQRLEQLAEEIGVVPDAGFWAMDFALFALMRQSAKKVLS